MNAFSGAQQQAAESAVKNNLANAAKSMKFACSDTGICPTSIPGDVNVSPNVGLSLSQAADTSNFCVNGSYKGRSAINYSYDSATGGIKTGYCSGALIPLSETGAIAKNLVLDTSFTGLGGASSQWGFGRSTGNITPTARPGATGDPDPDKPVLVLANPPASGTTWTYMHGPVAATQIVSGQQYTTSYYVRSVSGTPPGSINKAGVLDGNGTNVALSQSATAGISGSWTQVQQTVTAAKDGASSNVLYFGISAASTANAWTLEFQGFKIEKT